jgi:transcriptional regulator with PAS, ATPase and Fis domain
VADAPKRAATLRIEGGRPHAAPANVRRFRLTLLADGRRAAAPWQSSGERCAIGSHPLNDLVIDDPTVSRFHCEVRLGPEGAEARDLSSLNGTLVDGVPVGAAFLRSGSLLRVGNAVLRFDLGTGENPILLSQEERFGSLVGASVPMRAAFALLERAAASDATVLLEGETGTGKGQAAQSIHAASSRREKPLVVVDCATIPASLIESELFGHEKGAFTGADQKRAGAFETASAGTLFLDEIGELPAELQPKLLRVLEDRSYRPVGSNAVRRAEARVIAATNRDLRAEVNAGRFRADLYFRLAVVKIHLPPLSRRLEDMPLLAAQLLGALGASAAQKAGLLTPRFTAHLASGAWPGNVRELRNYLERCLVLGSVLPVTEDGEVAARTPDLRRPWEEARKRAMEDFEQRYVEALLERHGGKVPAAARAAELDPKYLYKLIQKHKLRRG